MSHSVFENSDKDAIVEGVGKCLTNIDISMKSLLSINKLKKSIEQANKETEEADTEKDMVREIVSENTSEDASENSGNQQNEIAGEGEIEMFTRRAL